MIYDSPRSRSFIDLCPRSLRFKHLKTSFPPNNTWPFEAKFHMEPPWDVGMKICHMTKMASSPIYGKNLQIFLSSEPKH